MILHKCNKGHYYDSDKFAECPYCTLAQNIIEDPTDISGKSVLEATETVVGKYNKFHKSTDGGTMTE
ncbi:MAG TPA: hypothetical protein DHV96_10065 [Lachnospiraceae bacterium]|nr:hypothetical protein [Lachnospiraceae bacterium]